MDYAACLVSNLWVIVTWGMRAILGATALLLTVGCESSLRFPQLVEVWYYHPAFLDQGSVSSDWWTDITRMEEIDGKLLISGRRVNYWNLNGTLSDPTPRILFPQENYTLQEETKFYEGLAAYLCRNDLSHHHDVIRRARSPTRTDEEAVIERCKQALERLPGGAPEVARYLRAATSSILK